MMASERPFRQGSRLAAEREFADLAALLRRVATALKLATDPLERVQLASELRAVQIEIDTFMKRHDNHISEGARKYLSEVSLQVEIKLTAMAAQAARRGRMPPRAN